MFYREMEYYAKTKSRCQLLFMYYYVLASFSKLFVVLFCCSGLFNNIKMKNPYLLLFRLSQLGKTFAE